MAGLLSSTVLFVGSYSSPTAFLYWPQAIGFFACMVLRGVHTATKADFAMIAIPVNAAIYSVVILGLMRILAKRNTAGRATGPSS
jgi:hypothetical protein